MVKILIVDDEPSITESIQYNLEKEGFSTLVASDGEKALEAFAKEKPDMVILDLMLPNISGEDVCKYIRKDSQVPIIMLTAKGEEIDRIVGLEIGADDYLAKPFSMRELIARIKAILRRITDSATPKEEASITVGSFELDKKRHEMRLANTPLELTLKEFEIMELFIRNTGQALTRDVILNRIWGEDYFGGTKTVDVHIRRLRKKIERDPSCPQFIQTVRGVGYRFEVKQ